MRWNDLPTLRPYFCIGLDDSRMVSGIFGQWSLTNESQRANALSICGAVLMQCINFDFHVLRETREDGALL